MVNPRNGKDYSALQQNNPYRNYQYTQSAWDKIGNWLNSKVFKSDFLKTKEKAVADEMANKANAYDAQIGEVQREEAYNSAEEQSQRMREAGINPDLENSGISGGEASAFDNQAASEMPTAEQLQNLSDDSGRFIQDIIAIPSAIIGIAGSGIDLAAKAAMAGTAMNTLFKTTNEAASDFIGQYLTGTGDLKSLKELSDNEILSTIMKDEGLKSQYPLVSMRKNVAKSIVRQLRSMDTEAATYNKQGELYGARSNPMNFDETSAGIIMDLTYKFNEARLKSLSRQYDGDYLEADLRALKLEAMRSLIDEFRSLYSETNNRAYAYAATLANQIMSGQIDDAIKTFASTEVLEGAIAAKNILAHELTTGENPEGENDIFNIEYPDGIKPDSPAGKVYRQFKVFQKQRQVYKDKFKTKSRRFHQLNPSVDDERRARKANNFWEKHQK